jgi:hypothetical protein
MTIKCLQIPFSFDLEIHVFVDLLPLDFVEVEFDSFGFDLEKEVDGHLFPGLMVVKDVVHYSVFVDPYYRLQRHVVGHDVYSSHVELELEREEVVVGHLVLKHLNVDLDD